MIFSQLSLRTRLYAGFGIVLFILIAVTSVGYLKVRTIETALRANSERDALIQRYAINFRGSAHDRSIAVRDVVLSGSDADRANEVAAIARLAGFYSDSSGPLEKFVTAPDAAPELAQLYADIKSIELQAVSTTQRIVAMAGKNEADQARTALWAEAKPQYVRWLASINKLIDFEELRIKASNQVASKEAEQFLGVMLAALAVALVIGVSLAVLIERSISRQLGAEPADLGLAAQRVTRGDLTPLPRASGAPAGSVLASLGAMQVSLAGIVTSVRVSSGAIASGSVEIASGTQDLSRRTEQQASSLEQTAASMEQLSATVKQNSDNAREANQLALSASEVAVQGGAVVQEVVETMKEINDSSKRIADIIGVIDGIAFQTNILALNAAVEAARAGEQGRGFAVVATEVRSLAQRSAGAAKEIKALIETSVNRVEDGTKLVDRAGLTMRDVVQSIERVTTIMGEITSASTEQSAGISQVAEAVTQMDRVTQQNAALVEQSAAASESLTSQATLLVKAVEVFRLA